MRQNACSDWIFIALKLPFIKGTEGVTAQKRSTNL